MKKSFGAQSWMFPMPVLILAVYNEDGTVNTMNAAWGGIHNTNEIGICLDENHKTTQDILRCREFSVSFADRAHIIASDYVGIVSGNDIADKTARAGFHCEPAEKVNAPVLIELPVALECRLIDFDEESGYLTASIVNVRADESVLDSEGKIDLSLFSPLIYEPVRHGYYAFGEKVGQAFHDGKALI